MVSNKILRMTVFHRLSNFDRITFDKKSSENSLFDIIHIEIFDQKFSFKITCVCFSVCASTWLSWLFTPIAALN